MKRILSIFVMLLIALPAMAQSSKITAKVVDSETKDGVIGAIVEVVSKTNADYRKHATTGVNGDVAITSLVAGDYTMTVQFVGYTTHTQDITVKGTTALGTIELVEGVAIETVVKEVQALRTSQNGDTVAYNAAAFKVAADADVEGLLKKMPGITISNGSVEAQGEQVKKIFVDGKEFFGEDVSTALNSLPAQAVDRIEVFNKLSDNAEFSGMDDGEGYKAINIVTHANMRQGVFGKVYGGYGYQPDIDGGAPADLAFNNQSTYDPQVGDVTSHHKYNIGGNVNVLELGCGRGEYTVALAERNPDKNYIGIDIKGARMWRGAKTATERNMANVGFVRTRIEFIQSFFAEGEVAEIWITFPDPQLKSRRAKKRLTSPLFLAEYKRFLTADGVINLKTDSKHLYRYTAAVIERLGLDAEVQNDDIYGSGYADEVLSVKTAYETKFVAMGLPITYTRFRLGDCTEFEHFEWEGDDILEKDAESNRTKAF